MHVGDPCLRLVLGVWGGEGQTHLVSLGRDAVAQTHPCS